MDSTEGSTTRLAHRHWLARTASRCHGVVLDLGAGQGALGAFLPVSAQWIALEPRPSGRLRRAVAGCPEATVLAGAAETIPLDDATVDAVVCATVLCSVTDAALALREAHRVLRPGGILHFSEHVAAPAGSIAHRLQGMLSRFTRFLGRSCDPCRDTAAVLQASPFRDIRLEHLRYPGALGMLGPLIRGTAVA